MFGSNPFGQSSSSPFGSQSVFGQTNNASSNPFASKPFGNASPFGTQSGGSMFGGTSTGVFGSQSSASTSVFGASSAPAFGNAPAFGASSGSPAFGQKPAFGGFGSSTTQTSPFGSSFQQSQPAFGSNLFGSSTPFGTQNQPGFGASSSPVFGAASTPAFGGTSTGVFGQTASSTFGSTSGGFGLSSPFGSSTPAFSTSSSSAFGATTAPSFGSTPTPSFGSTPTPFGSAPTPAFGATPTPAFGSSLAPAFGATPAPAFGSSSTAFNFGSSPAFGQSTSAFGSSPFGTTSSFGAQSAAFGTQPTTPTFGQQPAFGVQRGGSRVSPYSPTPETDGAAGTQPGKLESISAMPVYKDKSHEELRWEDYQLGDKGGPTTAGQSTAAVGFGISGIGSTATPSFGQASANPFSSSISPNPFAPKTPSFSSPAFGSSPAFSPSPFGTTSTSNPFGSTSSATSSLFGPTTQSFGVNTTSPSLFSSSATSAFGPPSIFGTSAQGTTSAFSTGLGFGNSQSSSLFQSTTPAFSQTSSPFAQTSSAFGQTASGFGQSNLFSTSSSGFSSNLFSSSSPLLSNSNTLGFGQTTPFSTPFQLVQPAQNTGGFNFSNLGQSQAGGTSGFTGTPGIFGQSSFGQQPAPQNIMAAQAPLITNPFGTLPAMPQMSIGGPGSSIQYGISSLPVVEKPMPARISSFLTSRHLSQRRGRMPIRKYHPNADGAKVPFFSVDEEIQSTPKADAFYVPRENPRALVIRPLEQWPSRSSAEKTTPLKFNPVHVNAALGEESKEHEHANEQVNNPVEGNQKAANGVHDPKKEISLTGHRANEAAIVYEHGADIEALMPKLRHSDYFTEPRIQEIAAKERSNPGFSRHVKDFVVGRHGFGSIKFFGETDVRRLDLESLVQFNNREVIVYMDEMKKPPIGQGLNKPAEVTLLNIKVFDKKSGEQITEGSRIEKYKAMLKRKAEDQGAEFVSYDPVKGEWKFRVDHFSRYKLRDEDDESDGDL